MAALEAVFPDASVHCLLLSNKLETSLKFLLNVTHNAF